MFSTFLNQKYFGQQESSGKNKSVFQSFIVLIFVFFFNFY